MNSINIVGKVFWVSTENKAPFPQTTLGISTSDDGSVFVQFPRDHKEFLQKNPDIKGQMVCVPEAQFTSSSKDGEKFFYSVRGSRVFKAHFQADSQNHATIIGKVAVVSPNGLYVEIQKRKNPKKPDAPPGTNRIPVWFPSGSGYAVGDFVQVNGRAVGKREGIDHALIEATSVERIEMIYA